MASPWTWRLALALLGLGLGGCTDDSFECFPSPAPITELEPAPGVVVTGRRVRMEITPTAESTGCGTLESALPVSATAEVEGPDGQPVENQFTLVQRFRAPSILEFTPQLPGPHHIVVTFSHVGGLHQFDLHAAADRSAETPSETIPKTCESLERTSKGAWICDTSVVRGSTVVRTFPGASLAVSGDVLWVVDSLGIQRYVDTGSDLVQSAAYSHGNGSVEFLLASPNELVVLHASRLWGYAFNGATIAPAFGQTWTRPPDPLTAKGPYGVLMREGARLGVVTRSPGFPDKEAVQVCTYQTPPGGFFPPQGSCPSVPGELIGFEPGVLWTRDLPAFGSQGQNQGLTRRWVWTQGQLQEVGSISLGPHASIFERPLKRSEAAPLVRNFATDSDIPAVTGVLTWSPQRQAIFLEHFDSSLAGVLASRAFYWGALSGEPSSSTRIRMRPPPP